MLVSIYGLCDPRTGHLRYIGKANNPRHRLFRHRCTEPGKNHRSDWLRCLKGLGLKPDMWIIEEVPEDRWQESEQFWICYFRSIGCPLVNATSGGDGGATRSVETCEKLRLIAVARPKPSAETRAKMSRSHKGNTYRLGTKNKRPRAPHTAETRQKMSASHEGIPLSESHRTNVVKAKIGYVTSAETKEKIRKALLGRKMTWGHKISETCRRKRELRVITILPCATASDIVGK